VIVPVETFPLALVLEDLGIRADRVRSVLEEPGAKRADATHALAAIAPGAAASAAIDAAAAEVVRLASERMSADGALLCLLHGKRADAELARWRNALWPCAHVGVLYRLSHLGIERETLQGRTKLRGATGVHGVLLAGYRREHVLSPGATVAKFDQNAAGWASDPGSPGYAHYRWMRRFVAEFAGAERLRGARAILDFGCGAGWVGIEAALQAPQASLSAFDPSAEMVRLAGENARASGLARFEARTGFGEEPPFPAAGEAPFDLVISSGVWSFAPDPARWIDGLARTVAPGGTLVLGDVHRESRGMRRRRATKPLLPAREMNARTREEARAALEPLGFRFEAWAGYQRTRPVPELMHLSEARLGGALNPLLLAWNRSAARGDARGGARHPERFDSWVARFVRG
jgi:SAM-dependent methyltransferase